jgi:stage II sporulation SpoE-like protein
MTYVALRSLSRPLAALALGFLALAAGVALARAWLPEWLPGELPSRESFVNRYRELAQRAGIRLPAAQPRVGFAGRDEDVEKLDDKVVDRLGPDRAAAVGAGLLVAVKQEGVPPKTGTPARELRILFLPSGDPVVIGLANIAELVKDSLEKKPAPSAAEQARFAQLLLRPGERFGPTSQREAGALARDVTVGKKADEIVGVTYPIVGSDPPQYVAVMAPAGGALRAMRKPSDAGTNDIGKGSLVAALLLRGLPVMCGVAAVIVLFFLLLGRRRIDFLNGLLLAAVVLVVAVVPSLFADPSWLGALQVLGAFFLALWVLLIWSTSESFLRSLQPALTLGLDTLRTGRLGPRGGRALLYGVAAGAFLAGLRLAVLALASHLPRAWPEDSSIRLPLFGARTPLNGGVLLAASAALAIGLASRFLPARWVPWAAAVGAGLAFPFASCEPAWLYAAAGLVVGGVLVFLCLQAGLAAVLAAGLSAYLLQAAAFSALHLNWLPISFAFAAGIPALFLALGFVGLSRPPQAELERIKQPAFMKRLEEEQRVRYEMDLLARMQRGLLPTSLPEIAGWEIAARSLLATEAGGDLYDFLRDEQGRLWIAAGDVAGHGYSCAIAQSMTSAALASLVTAEKTPAEVLGGIDRVIRRASTRNFTSLALVRLDPRTGEALMSNAGHPFPLLLLGAAGGVEEIDLPGLPLGQGPPRTYADLPFEIPPGSSLVFCSDGLFEAADARENLYGYEHPRELLHSYGDRPAAEILEALFTDWRRHLGGQEHQDDTTVVVVKRAA